VLQGLTGVTLQYQSNMRPLS